MRSINVVFANLDNAMLNWEPFILSFDKTKCVFMHVIDIVVAWSRDLSHGLCYTGSFAPWERDRLFSTWLDFIVTNADFQLIFIDFVNVSDLLGERQAFF